MTDPQAPANKPKPRRADPIQPDKPGSGNEVDAEKESGTSKPDDDAAAKQKRQSQAALDNVREGYD